MDKEDYDFDSMFKKIVLVTGFGPFDGHPVNASWEAVKILPKEDIEDEHNIELVTLEIPVTYGDVDNFVPALWETHEPKLMVHVGVSKLAKSVTLEKLAHRKGYSRKDYFDQCPCNLACETDGAVVLTSKLDVERICSEINEIDEEAQLVTSCDAGRYLCEYIYYKSLHIDQQRSVFIHVPDQETSSSEKTAQILRRIISKCIEQVDEFDKKRKEDESNAKKK